MTEELIRHAAIKGPSAELYEKRHKSYIYEARANKRKSLHPDTDLTDVHEFIHDFELPKQLQIFN